MKNDIKMEVHMFLNSRNKSKLEKTKRKFKLDKIHFSEYLLIHLIYEI